MRNKCTVTFNSLSQHMCKKEKLTVYTNDLRFLLLKTVLSGILVAKTAALNERLRATQCTFLKESNKQYKKV